MSFIGRKTREVSGIRSSFLSSAVSSMHSLFKVVHIFFRTLLWQILGVPDRFDFTTYLSVLKQKREDTHEQNMTVDEDEVHIITNVLKFFQLRYQAVATGFLRFQTSVQCGI
jgi:hypothetical protein